jgi:transcriptional regulator with XRE-family HTH domain
MTQEQLSEAAGVNFRHLRWIERARANLLVETLVRLAEALEVSAAYLLRRARLSKPTTGRPKKKRRAFSPPRRTR